MSDTERQQTIGWLDEEPGVRSSTRIKSAVCLLASVGLAFVTVLKAGDPWTGSVLTALFLLAAFYPQYLKQVIESKVTK